MTGTTHNEEHERILSACLVGDLPDDCPQLQTATETCPECRSALTGMRALTQRLDRAAWEERHSITAALDRQWMAGERLVDATLRARGSWRGGVRVWLAAAAAALVGALALNAPTEPAAPERTLGAPVLVIEPVAPRGEIAGRITFEWRGTERATATSLLRIVIRPFVADAETLDYAVSGSRWTPDPGIVNTWSNEFDWQVRVMDSAGGLRSSPWVRVRRQP